MCPYSWTWQIDPFLLQLDLPVSSTMAMFLKFLTLNIKLIPMIFISKNNICMLSIQSSKSLISSLLVLELLLLLLLPHSYSLSDLSPSVGPDISQYKILMGVIKPGGKVTSALYNHSWCYSREGSGGGGGVLLWCCSDIWKESAGSSALTGGR